MTGWIDMICNSVSIDSYIYSARDSGIAGLAHIAHPAVKRTSRQTVWIAQVLAEYDRVLGVKLFSLIPQ